MICKTSVVDVRLSYGSMHNHTQVFEEILLISRKIWQFRTVARTIHHTIFFINFSVLALHNVIWHAIKYTCAFVPRFGSSWSPCPGTDSLPFWSSVSFPTTVRLIPYFLRNRVYLRCGCNVELKIKAVSSLRCAFSSSHYIVYTMASYRRIDHNNITAELGACIGNSSLVRRIHVNTHFG